MSDSVGNGGDGLGKDSLGEDGFCTRVGSRSESGADVLKFWNEKR